MFHAGRRVPPGEKNPILPLVYHKTGENGSAFPFMKPFSASSFPGVKMYVRCLWKNFEDKFLKLPLDTKYGMFSKQNLRYGMRQIMVTFQIFMLKSKKGNCRLHKKVTQKIRWKVESGMGQGVFHIFHRVFHILGYKRNWFYVNGLKIGDFLRAKKEFFCKKRKNIYFSVYFCHRRRIWTAVCRILAVFLFEICEEMWYNVRRMLFCEHWEETLGRETSAFWLCQKYRISSTEPKIESYSANIGRIAVSAWMRVFVAYHTENRGRLA